MPMDLTREQLASLETPCLVIDMQAVRANLQSMQRAVSAAGCRLRPHIKTHKMPLFARMQIEAGACGITCAKVSEAEVMADGGLRDIFIAYPMVGEHRIRRAAALARRVDRLILAVDSSESADALSKAAVRENTGFEVRLEIDTGAGRTGVPLERAVDLAAQIHAMPGLRLTGIYTFKSLVYQGAPTADIELAAREEGELMAEAARRIREAGVPIEDISAGSSPTGEAVARTGLVNEVRPGTYIFKDQMLCREGVARPEEIAVRYAATVVSAQHAEYAVLDGGCKFFATDVVPDAAPHFYHGYAAVDGRPELCLSRMNEEHGILTAESGATGLHVGDVLLLTPIHVCTAVNQQNAVWLLDNGTLTRVPVKARGMTV